MSRFVERCNIKKKVEEDDSMTDQFESYGVSLEDQAWINEKDLMEALNEILNVEEETLSALINDKDDMELMKEIDELFKELD